MPQFSRSPLGLELQSSEENQSKVKIGSYKVLNNGKYYSLFSRDKDDRSASQFNMADVNYSDSLKVTDIVSYTSTIPSMRLNYADFAYLKNLGVYPNNRLIVARRFEAPVSDDLTTLNTKVSDDTIRPISTLVSWVPDNKEFIKFDYGENWTDGEASFRELLNELGQDILMGDNKGGKLGNMLSGAANGVSLFGWTEGLQLDVFKALGMSDLASFQHPYGNPNLIRESMRRATTRKEERFSGLKCKFEVEMEVEYEQKFINGIDPTIVYYDIIANALTFGTSESKFQFKGDAADDFNQFLNNLTSGNSERVKKALLDFVSALSEAIRNVAKTMIDKIKGSFSKSDRTSSIINDDTKQKAVDDANAAEKEKQKSEATKPYELLQDIGFSVLQGMVSKYKVRIMGIVNALTGSPSAPWHVTIGNPKRPIFSSGDMLVEEVTITMGKLLAFNDLPSSIKINFKLKSARNIGAQEIFKKLNCGKERTYVRERVPFIESDWVWDKKAMRDYSLSSQENTRLRNIKDQGKIDKATYDKDPGGEIARSTSGMPDSLKSLGRSIALPYTSGELQGAVVSDNKFGIDNAKKLSVASDGKIYGFESGKLEGFWKPVVEESTIQNGTNVLKIIPGSTKVYNKFDKLLGVIDASGNFTKINNN